MAMAFSFIVKNAKSSVKEQTFRISLTITSLGNMRMYLIGVSHFSYKCLLTNFANF